MAFTRAQTTSKGFAAANETVQFPGNNTAGNFLAAIVLADSTTLTVSDATNGSWTKIVSVGATATLGLTYLFIKANCAGGVRPVITFTATGSLGEAEIVEYAGVATTATAANATGTFYDAAAGTNAWNIATSTGAALSGDLAISGTGDANVPATERPTTNTTGWASGQASGAVASCTLFDLLGGTATGTITDHVSSTSSSNWPSVIATFSAAGGAVDPFPAGYNQPGNRMNSPIYRMERYERRKSGIHVPAQRWI